MNKKQEITITEYNIIFSIVSNDLCKKRFNDF